MATTTAGVGAKDRVVGVPVREGRTGLKRWLGPDYRHFRVSASDGDTYILRHDGRDGEWDLAAFRRGH